MKMNQIVYVVVDKKDENLIGAYNEYKDALETLRSFNSPTVSITPVLVDAAPDYCRYLLFDENLIDERTKDEIELAQAVEVVEDEDEDEDYDDDEYDEDEDEEDDEEEDVIPDFSALAWLLESLL